MRRTHLWAWAVVVCLFSVPMVCAQSQPASDVSSAPASVAAVPRLIKYSGVVRDARGEPLGNVAVRLTFAVCSEQQGGAALWAESQVVQLDEQGHYTVLLGATRADGLPVELFPAGKARWLGVQVEGRDEDARVLLVSVPYALKAEDAAMLGGRSAADFVLGEQLKEEVRTQVAAQTPGIATQAVEMLVSNPPKAPAIAQGPSTFTCATSGDCVAVTQSGTGHALRTTATSTTEAVLVQQNGTGYGLRALSPGNIAVLGQVTGSAGTSYGVKGQTTSTTGAGVFGYNLATTGLAYGVLGQTASTEGTAFFGRAVATTGATIGLRGHADSTGGTGILGQATATSGTTTGIVGRVFSAAGTALVVDNTKGGKLLSGQVNGAEKISADGSGNLVAVGALSGTQLISTVASGTAPLSVTSNTLVPNLNADLLDGLHAANFATLGANVFVGNQAVTGNVTATGFWGDGSGLTGISGGTGGVENTGSTTIGADTDSDGVGEIALQTRQATRVVVRNDGKVGIGTASPASLLDVEGSSADQIVSVSQSGSGSGITATTAATGSLTALQAAIVGTATGSYAAGVEGISTGDYTFGVFGMASAPQTVAGLFINTGGGDLISAGTSFSQCEAQCAFGVSSAGNLHTAGNAMIGGNLASAGTLSGTQLISTVASGTAPLSVTSNTLVPNLNADLLDGFHAAAFAPAAGSIAYVSKAGDTMTGTLNLPANGLVAGTNQLVLSGGKVGIGGTPSAYNFTEIKGTIATPTPSSYAAHLMMIDGTAQATSYGQAYLKALVVNPTYDVTAGYANYLTGIEVSPGTRVGSNVAHSVVSFLANGQPTGGLECSVAFGVDVPNQQISLCNGSYGFYQGSTAQYNYFKSNVGIGKPAPAQALDVAGNIVASGSVTATSFVGALTGAASDVSCSGCVNASDLAADAATQAELDAEATARAAADTTVETAANGRVLKAGDTMVGTLNLPADGLVAGTNQLVLSGGNVGIGVTTPAAKLDVAGSGNFATSTGIAIVGTATGSYAMGVEGISTADHTAGVFGVSSGGPNTAGGHFVNTGGGDLISACTTMECTTNLFEVSNTGNVKIAGNLNVVGAISAGTKDFKIDDPLDPDHKFLYHASVESSEMMDMYTGNVTTDAHGDAVVQLPAWFQALNRDFRYQLTVIGQFAQAIVAQEIRNNRFTIKTDKAKVKVSWQVTGVRHDAYAKAHPLQVEVDKPERTQ